MSLRFTPARAARVRKDRYIFEQSCGAWFYRVNNAFVYDEISPKKFSEEELRHGYRAVLR
jgi:hypothetical protein